MLPVIFSINSKNFIKMYPLPLINAHKNDDSEQTMVTNAD